MAPAIDIYPFLAALANHQNWAIGTAILCLALFAIGMIGVLKAGKSKDV